MKFWNSKGRESPKAREPPKYLEVRGVRVRVLFGALQFRRGRFAEAGASFASAQVLRVHAFERRDPALPVPHERGGGHFL